MSNCHNAKSCNKSFFYKNVGWLPTVFIALLPKCPFCIMAYSGAMTLCSGTTLYPHASSKSSVLILIISIFILLSLALNYKKWTTIISAGIVLGGILMMVLSQYYFMNEASYYLGVGMLFLGVWYNGSLLYFLRKIKFQNKLLSRIN